MFRCNMIWFSALVMAVTVIGVGPGVVRANDPLGWIRKERDKVLPPGLPDPLNPPPPSVSGLTVTTPPYIDRDGNIHQGTGRTDYPQTVVGRAQLSHDPQGRAFWHSNWSDMYGRVQSPIRAYPKYDVAPRPAVGVAPVQQNPEPPPFQPDGPPFIPPGSPPANTRPLIVPDAQNATITITNQTPIAVAFNVNGQDYQIDPNGVINVGADQATGGFRFGFWNSQGVWRDVQFNAANAVFNVQGDSVELTWWY